MPRYWALAALLVGCIISAADLCEPPNRLVLKGHCANILLGFDPSSPYDCCGDAYPNAEGRPPYNAFKPAVPIRSPDVNALQPPPKYITAAIPSPSPKQRLQEHCGQENENLLNFSMPEAEKHPWPGQYPWLIALFSNGTYLEGASLVAPGTVLTAAYLVMNRNADDIVVRAGDFDFLLRAEQFPPEERRVARIRIHENFQYQTQENNLALLYLKSPYKLRSHIAPVCSPGQGKSFEQKRCIIAGWGKRVVHPYTTFTDVQIKMDVPIVSRALCQNQLRQTRLRADYNLPESLLCAGGEKGKDACFFDGGSALLCKQDHFPYRYDLAGIFSFGLCELENMPSTFTNLGMFGDWLHQHI
ncbi:phenoloxidase-activating factor 2 [Drosophila biarmipes]|uniref:phenoloxidase-activating factor 2 n=1 Tax=Drosophila biarmipes TaxID=125945 RepID=UPI0007E64758|nr:phenoloxidase-activating factor 2 [Drosophila biarmipes]